MGKRKKKSDSPSPGRRKGRAVRLRPANPFDLIRLLAESQNDPRKAMAELVQNSLDAGARNITITRMRRRGEPVVTIRDDGQGVFPDLERPEALERIATNIGRSFKMNLSPRERRKQMMLGKYGIGILGFWSLGREMEMRTRVAASEIWALRLVRNKPTAEVLRVPQQRIQFSGETWTELVIRGVRAGASRQISGRRLGDYLASELRGQLLERKVKLHILDRMARGTALKDFKVVPQRFRGHSILKIPRLEIPGFSPARVELYFVEDAEDRRPAVALTCGGAVVNDDLAGLEGRDLDHPPWASGCLEGVVEFPDLEVAPATRRGFQPGPAAEALLAAIRSIEPELFKLLDSEKEKRRAEEDQNLAREIRKVFRPLAKNLPQYDFFEITSEARDRGEDSRSGGERLGRASGEEASPGDAGEGAESSSEVVEEGGEPDPGEEILPPGPLARAHILPRKSRLLPGASRAFQARAVDENGRPIPEGISYYWKLQEGGGILSPRESRATFKAPEEPGEVKIAVEAWQGVQVARAEAEVDVVERLSGEMPDAGIPDPERVFDRAGDWRSRMAGRRWQYNAAHPDYQAVANDTRRRFRYLVHLFAKEIVLRNYGEPKDERLLERVVEVLTHIRPRL